jgi:hypothetical protein
VIASAALSVESGGVREVLGKNYQSCFTRTTTESASSGHKWARFRTAKQLLPDSSRLASCTHRVNSQVYRGRGDVSLWRKGQSAWFGGVWQCNDVWRCPVCSPRISEHRRERLKVAVDRAVVEGHGVALVTLTFPHGAGDVLTDILEKFTKATRALKSGKRAVTRARRIRYLGEIKTLEVTHGANGWHPHSHAIWFTEKPLPQAELDALRDDLLDHWRTVCRRVGLPEPSREHGVDVRGARHAAEYIAKWGFTMELAGNTAKRAKKASGGRTPWQLLADASEGDKRAGWLWREFALAFADKRQLIWTRGLAKRLRVDEGDDQSAFDLDEKSELVTVIDHDTWVCIALADAQAEVISAAIRDERELYALLNHLRITQHMHNGGAPPGPRECWQW